MWHWDRFLSQFFSLPVSIISPWLHTHIPSGRQTTGLLVAAVQRHNLTPSKLTTLTTTNYRNPIFRPVILKQKFAVAAL
jgi:hypothetical protein